MKNSFPTGKSQLSDCVNCSPGRYCLESGNDTTTADCQAGYYCVSKAEIPNPTGTDAIINDTKKVNFLVFKIQYSYMIHYPWFFIILWILVLTDGTTGDVCPIGHYCPTGSSTPQPCSSSTYMNHTGAAACYTCPQGYFCTSGSTADPCPQGYYCPIGTGTDKKPCPVGKYHYSDYI